MVDLDCILKLVYSKSGEGPPSMRGRGGWTPGYSWMDSRMGPGRGVKRPWPDEGQGWRGGRQDFPPRPPMDSGWHQGLGPPRFEPPGKFPEPRKLPLGFDGGDGFRMRGEEGPPGGLGHGPGLGAPPGPRGGPPMPLLPPRNSPGRDWGMDEPRPPQFREGWGDRGPVDDRLREVRHPEEEDRHPEHPAPPLRKV